jgi:glycosyltransferase involved in cell wall biosynthesis
MKISVIICTYNPDPIIFGRVLNAVAGLYTNKLETELILVDNNSSKPVCESFSELIDSIPFEKKLVFEPKSGLTNARMAGFAASSGDFLVFFDDDNEPEPDYLQEVRKAFLQFPNVGVFGPGNIFVEFMGNPPPWIHYNKSYFQERNYSSPRYACAEDWMDFFPPGTGQSMRREIFIQYANLVSIGELSASDRNGKSLSSAGDVQLVFEANKLNYAAGVHPKLKTKHLISENKTNASYIRRLLFGMASSYPEAYAECFPHTRNVLPYYTNWKIFRIFCYTFSKKILIKKSPKAFIFELAELLGKIYGSNHARGENKNSFWFSLITLLKLK